MISSDTRDKIIAWVKSHTADWVESQHNCAESPTHKCVLQMVPNTRTGLCLFCDELITL